VYNFVTLLHLGVFLKDTSLILLAAGSSSRFNKAVKKQWLRIEDKPLWQFVTDNFKKSNIFKSIIITASEDEVKFMKKYGEYNIIKGGSSRQQSLKNALLHVKTPYVIVSDIARACIDINILNNLIEKIENFDVVVPVIGLSDTKIYKNKTIDRDEVKRVQTPQISKTDILKKALNSDIEYTDESSAIVAYGGKRGFIDGQEDAKKITFANDLKDIPCLMAPSNDIFCGNGFDVHQFCDTKSYMYLCGEKIECGYGLKAHSDGDVAIHALIDALLGAAGMGDIGELFPDNDDTYKGISSKILLERIVTKIYNFGFKIINVDLTIIAQQPKLSKYKDNFEKNLANILDLSKNRVNVKATTTEKLGFVGRKEGIAVIANTNLKFYNWMEEN